MITEILHYGMKIEGRLLCQGVVARVLDLRRLRAEGIGVLLAGRSGAGPTTVGATRSFGQTDHKVISVTGVTSYVIEEFPSERHHAVINPVQLRAFAFRLDTRHPAGTVASAFLLLALAILVGRALSQTLLTHQFRPLLVPRTHGRGRVSRVLVDPSIVVYLGLGLIATIVVVVLILVVPVIIILVVIVDSRLLSQLGFGREELGAQQKQQNDRARSHSGQEMIADPGEDSLETHVLTVGPHDGTRTQRNVYMTARLSELTVLTQRSAENRCRDLRGVREVWPIEVHRFPESRSELHESHLELRRAEDDVVSLASATINRVRLFGVRED